MAFECASCGECCRRYWIMVLPSEVKAISSSLRISQEDFLKDYCSFFLEFYPSPGKEGTMMVNSAMVPSKIIKELERFTVPPGHFLVLPSIALKRIGKECIFHDVENNECRIHSVKPLVCRLFPFLATEEELEAKKSFSKAYPFCRGLSGFSGAGKKENSFKKYYPLVEQYFEGVRLNGFKATWGSSWPCKGIAAYKRIELCTINEKDFFEAIEPYE